MFVSSEIDSYAAINAIRQARGVSEAILDTNERSKKFPETVNVRITTTATKILNACQTKVRHQKEELWVLTGTRVSESSSQDLAINTLTAKLFVSNLLSIMKTQTPYHLEKVEFRVELLSKENAVLSSIYQDLDFNQPEKTPQKGIEIQQDPKACIIL